jgi:hypothetical protein
VAMVGIINTSSSINFENVGDFIGVPTDRFCIATGEEERILM